LQDTNLLTDPVRFAQTQAAIGRVPELARRVVTASHVNESPGALLASSDVNPDPNADLLVFTVRSGSPDLAQRLATNYGRQFTIYRRELDTAAMSTALAEIHTRLKQLKKAGGATTPEYSSLLSREQQLKTLENLQTSNTFLIREGGAAVKIKPQPQHNGILGALGGLLLGVCLAFIAEAYDKRVRSPEEIEAALHLPLLGQIPEPPRDRRRADELVMLAEPSSSEAEAFRVLRTNLQFLNADAQSKVIMITSSVAREGKSTTVASLAIAMARGGARVALVDLDLRSPALDRLFNIRKRPGFTEAALGVASLEEATHWVPISGTAAPARTGNGRSSARLDVIPSGTLPLNPAEFVESNAAERVLALLRERYDYVLVDAPPLLPVSDGISLSAKVDGMIVVVRIGLVERSSLRECARTLERCPALKLGVAITGAPASTQYYYGSSSSSSGRGAERRSEFVT
jgi:capsular exopolysaccharide synthesis family protein